jgi:hypothetical protein
LRQTCLASGHVPNGKKGKTANNGAKSKKASIAALEAMLAALVVEKDNEGQGTTESTVNRNNDILRQQPGEPGE